MARENFAHFGNNLVFPARKLRRTALAPFLIGGNRSRGLGAVDQILDLHLAARLLVRALNDHARRIALVGIFELVAHVFGIAEIKLGADFCGTQGRAHLLIVGAAIAIEYCDDHGAKFGLGVELAEHRERGLQPRHADGKSGRRHRLAANPRDEAIIAPAAADRTKTHRTAFFVFGVEKQFNLVDGAGVIFEAADDRNIYIYPTRTIAGSFTEFHDLNEFV